MPELYLYTNIHWSRVNDKKVNAVGLFDTIHQLCVALLYLNDILMSIVSFLMCTYVRYAPIRDEETFLFYMYCVDRNESNSKVYLINY